MTLARRFNAGKGRQKDPRRVATPETWTQPSLRDERICIDYFSPGVETPA
ncbi:MAG: hypothetical protein ABJA18_05685 [bacterium]